MQALTLKQALRERLDELAETGDSAMLSQCAGAVDVFASIDPTALLAAIGDDMTALMAAIAPDFQPDDRGHVRHSPTMLNWTSVLAREILNKPMQHTSSLLYQNSELPRKVPEGHALVTPVWQLVLPALSRLIAQGAAIEVRDEHRWVIDPLTGKPQDHISMRMYAITMRAVGIAPTAADVAMGMDQFMPDAKFAQPVRH
ncbi:MAG: hypothetical protein ACK5NN_15520 [Sphingomonadaceae bacterium]